MRRRIVNEVELVRLLTSRGFEVVRPELLSLAQQARLFAEAEIVVGAHGAAHTNTLFSRRSVLIELFEPSFFNNCNLMLSRASGHDYWYVTGERSGPGDISAPLELVDATLDIASSRTRLGST